MKNETEIKTELELEQWLKDNCYPMNKYSINGNFIYEGFILENNSRYNPYFEWIYTERGEKMSLAEFYNEKDAVQFALKKIKEDKHANWNPLGIYKKSSEVEKIIAELNKREVEFWTDKIDFGGINDWRTKIFIIGCGIKKVEDLIQRE